MVGTIFLLLFAGTLFVLYIAVRRAWLGTLELGVGGTILNTLFVVLYALLDQRNSTAQAIFAAIVVGVGFSVMVTVAALFFRTNQPSAAVKLVSRAQPENRPATREDETGGTEDDYR